MGTSNGSATFLSTVEIDLFSSWITVVPKHYLRCSIRLSFEITNTSARVGLLSSHLAARNCVPRGWRRPTSDRQSLKLDS